MTNYIKLAKDRYKRGAKLNNVKLRLKNVNAAIEAKFPDVELVKGAGYFYLVGKTEEMSNKLYSIQSTSIYVYKLNELTLEQWLDDVERIIKKIGTYEPGLNDNL